MRILIGASYTVLVLLLFFMLLIRGTFFYMETQPEIPSEQTTKIRSELKGLLTNDGCLVPEIVKEKFKCTSPFESSYRFKCLKNGKALMGTLCRTGKSAYIRYDLTSFAE